MTSTSGNQSGQGSWQSGSTNTRAPAGTQSFEQDFISGWHFVIIDLFCN